MPKEPADLGSISREQRRAKAVQIVEHAPPRGLDLKNILRLMCQTQEFGCNPLVTQFDWEWPRRCGFSGASRGGRAASPPASRGATLSGRRRGAPVGRAVAVPERRRRRPPESKGPG